MGEIGFPRREFLHDIRWWEVKSIIRGYNNRHRNLWSANRWQTYNLMCAFAGSKALADSGIHKPTDLIEFPWDKKKEPEHISQQDIDELQAEIAAINAQHGRSEE